MRIDHISIGGSDLKTLNDEFTEVGMKPDYGGPHSNGVTHMSLLGFEDGSYIELISTVKPGMASSIWKKQIENDGGPCAWAIQAEDITVEVARANERGIPSVGPSDYNRRRPDGVLVEWQLGFLGEAEPGSTLPFLIRDTTPREYRVKPSASVSGKDAILLGVGAVVLGIRTIDEGVRLFRCLYGWAQPEMNDKYLEGVRLAHFAGTPVFLAAPRGSEWLGDRVRKFGDSPCAFLIKAKDIREASRRHGVEDLQDWFGGGRIGWIASLQRRGIMAGLLGP